MVCCWWPFAEASPLTVSLFVIWLLVDAQRVQRPAAGGAAWKIYILLRSPGRIKRNKLNVSAYSLDQRAFTVLFRGFHKMVLVMSQLLSSDLMDYDKDVSERRRPSVHRCLDASVCVSCLDLMLLLVSHHEEVNRECMCVCVCMCVHLSVRVNQWGSKSSRLISSQSPAEQMWGLIRQGIGGGACILVCQWGRGRVIPLK